MGIVLPGIAMAHLQLVPNNTQEEVGPLLKEGEDLNEHSDADDDDQLKHNWDDQGYQTNLICFINDDRIIDTQMWVAAGTIDNMVEPVYDHHTQIKDCVRISQKRNDYRAISAFWE